MFQLKNSKEMLQLAKTKTEKKSAKIDNQNKKYERIITKFFSVDNDHQC